MKHLETMMEKKATVLVLDDEKNIVTVLKAILEKREFHVEGFTEPRLALDALRKEKFDAVVTDLYMPEIDGMAFLAEVHRLYPGLPVVMITAFGTVDSAVDAIKKGAFDYVTKPFEQSEIVSVVQKAVSTSRLNHLESFEEEADSSLSPVLIGKCSAIQDLQKTLQKIAATPSTVLILGETGTGKEMLAEEIHQRSGRSFQGMLKINCAALSTLNIEHELFGAENKMGKLEMANKGTLFIDEISELSEDAQVRLLSYLESGKFENPVTAEIKSSDVRIIAATHKDLAREVKDGNFREDLFYKLNVVPVHLPSLRDRKEDFAEIVHYYLKKLNKRLQKNFTGIEGACLENFSHMAWPGNLSQLEHAMERMMVLGDGAQLEAKNIPADLRLEMDIQSSGESSSRFREIIKKQTQNLEKELIEKALQELDGNITKSAEHLGISRKGLQLKMKELGIK